MKPSIYVALAVATVFCLNGCLATLKDIRESEQRTAPVSAAQEKQAQAVARFDEYDQQFRSINGRLDVIENQLTQINAGHADRQNQENQIKKDIDGRLRVYEEALNKMEARIKDLADEVRQIREMKEAKAAPPPSAKGGKEAFQKAEAAYNNKEWKQAIVDYEAYRKANPKGKNYPTATFKIGMAFHELNMKDEARAFFEEVIAKFPSSSEAKKASQRLKSMK